jgi:hypothetical protein
LKFVFYGVYKTLGTPEQTDQVNLGESYGPLLKWIERVTSIIVDEGEETGQRIIETVETWIVYVCHTEGDWARQKM